MPTLDAYAAGYSAAKHWSHRLRRDDNPYDEGADRNEWDRGFTDAEIDAREAAAEYRAEARREERWLEKLNRQE